MQNYKIGSPPTFKHYLMSLIQFVQLLNNYFIITSLLFIVNIKFKQHTFDKQPYLEANNLIFIAHKLTAVSLAELVSL